MQLGRTRKRHIMLAKRVPGHKKQRNNISHYASKTAADATRDQTKQFSSVFFARKGCKRQLKIAFFPQFLTIELHFVRNCRIFVIARGHRACLKRE
jgi:hypothetical protein